MTCCPLKLLISPCFTGKSRAGTMAFDHLSTGLRKDYEVQCRRHPAVPCSYLAGRPASRAKVALKSTNELQSASESTRRNPLKSMPQSGAELWICVENAEKLASKLTVFATQMLFPKSRAQRGIPMIFCGSHIASRV